MNIKLTDKDKIRVSEPEDIVGIMQRILLRENKIDREKEHFWIVGMNNAGYILYIELISLGSATKTPVAPMNVFRVAVLKGAIRVIAVHNHPSGVMNPSEKDKDITDRLIQVGKILDIPMDDHVIITPTEYMSFRMTGLMARLEKSLKYVPPYQIAEMIRQEEREIREDMKKEEQALRDEMQKELKKAQQQKKEAEHQKSEVQQQVNKAIRKLLEKGMTSEQISDVLQIPLIEVEKIICS